MSYSRKDCPNTDEKTGGVEDMDCPGLLNREHVEIPEERNKNWNFQGCSQKTHCEMSARSRSWFLDLKFPPRGVVTQFCRFSRGEILFSVKRQI